VGVFVRRALSGGGVGQAAKKRVTMHCWNQVLEWVFSSGGPSAVAEWAKQRDGEHVPVAGAADSAWSDSDDDEPPPPPPPLRKVSLCYTGGSGAR
jgi:hypothetical protein